MSELVTLVRAALAGDEEAREELGDIQNAAELLCDEVDRLELEIDRLRVEVASLTHQETGFWGNLVANDNQEILTITRDGKVVCDDLDAVDAMLAQWRIDNNPGLGVLELAVKHLQLSERHRLAMLDRSPKPRSDER